MLIHLFDLQSTLQTTDGMRVDRDRAGAATLIRRASDRAGLRVVDVQGYMFLADSAGTLSWFNPLAQDQHAKTLFDAMRFTVSGRLLTRRVVSPTGASVGAVFASGKRWRKTVVEFAASHPASHRTVGWTATPAGRPSPDARSREPGLF
ncbi:hypothetical protein PQR02_02020 [Paraburkholderia sediminicola]|uniref:Uncharacterized protein n=1 Tax=Paraburkholderia rhynchosiae TaxID=487049 RepID=A0ACC7N413_9BURK